MFTSRAGQVVARPSSLQGLDPGRRRLAPQHAYRPPKAVSVADQHVWQKHVAMQCVWVNIASTNLNHPLFVRVVTYIAEPPASPSCSQTTIGPDERSQAGSPELPSRREREVDGHKFDVEMAEWLD
jgi:hypothetical protein